MNKNIYIVVAIIAGVLAGGAGMYLMTKGDGRVRTPEKTPTETGKKILYWQAPMDPTYVRNEPGKSPMGMDLVPVYEGEEVSEPGTVTIDPVTVQNIGVRTAIVEKKTLKKTIRTIGRVDYDEKRVSKVHTKVDGWIEKLYVDFTGKEVKEDDILLEIYSPTLVAAQEEYLLAIEHGEEIKGVGKESLKELSRRRLELWDVPPHQIKELEETGTVMRTLHIHSPAGGIVTEKPVTEGMYVRPGMSLYTIADISKVWVYADIYEYEIPLVRVGQRAEMTLEAYPGEVFRGRVAFIYPFMEAKSRTNKVRLEFDNPRKKLKPDMYTNVTIQSVVGRNRIAIPTEAVIRSGERNIVIIDMGMGKFSAREVTLGGEAEGYFEVKKGLKEGEKVVTSAQFLIDSESRLREAIGKMLKAEAAPKEMKHDTTEEKPMKDMQGMDHGEMKHDTAEETPMKSMEGMDHGEMKHETTEETPMKSMEGMDHESMKTEEKPMEHAH